MLFRWLLNVFLSFLSFRVWAISENSANQILQNSLPVAYNSFKHVYGLRKVYCTYELYKAWCLFVIISSCIIHWINLPRQAVVLSSLKLGLTQKVNGVEHTARTQAELSHESLGFPSRDGGSHRWWQQEGKGALVWQMKCTSSKATLKAKAQWICLRKWTLQIPLDSVAFYCYIRLIAQNILWIALQVLFCKFEYVRACLMNGEWGLNNWDKWIALIYYSSPFIPICTHIHPHSNEWEKFNPHSSPFRIHPTGPDILIPFKAYKANDLYLYIFPYFSNLCFQLSPRGSIKTIWP